MAFELHRPGHQFALRAASAILPRSAVRLAGTSEAFYLAAATMTDRPYGVVGPATAGASGLDQAEVVTAYERGNIVKALAGASLGANVEVAVGATLGSFQPVPAASLFAASGHWAVGYSLTPAAAGEVFALYVEPRKA